jgi:hemin uptake protein HemP
VVANEAPTAPPSTAVEGAATIDSAELMNGQRELQIRHGENVYRLRVTASEKLILTK